MCDPKHICFVPCQPYFIAKAGTMLAFKIYMFPKMLLIASELLIECQIQVFLLTWRGPEGPGGPAVLPQNYYCTNVHTDL